MAIVIKVFDKKNLSFTGPKQVYQDCFTAISYNKKLGAEETLSFTIPFSLSGSISIEDFVEYKGRKLVLKTIQTVRDTAGNRYLQISCEGIYSLLIDKVITPSDPNADIPDTWLQGVDARTALQRIVRDTPLTVGTVDDFGTWDFDLFDMNALEALNGVRDSMLGVDFVSTPGGGTTPIEPIPDTTPPSEVFNYNASVIPTAITLNWNNPMEYDFDMVYVYRNGTLLASLDKFTTSYSETNLTPNTLYSYQIKTKDKTGNMSSGITVTARTSTVADNTPPANVTNLAATKTNITANLTWVNPPDADFAKNKIYRNNALIAETTGNSYNAIGLSANTEYVFYVTSVDTSNNENTGSSITIKTDANIDSTPPANTATINNTVTQNSVVLNWTKPADVKLQKFNIYRNSLYLNEVPVTAPATYTDNTVVSNTTYSYKITSVDVIGNESGGTVQSVKTVAAADTTAPANVTNLSYSSNESSVTLFWTRPVDADFSKVKIYRNGAFITEATGTSYANTNLSANTTYTYKITSVDTTGNESIGSTIVTSTAALVDTIAPGNVSNLVANSTTNSITLSWTAPSDSDLSKYNIYRNGAFVTELPSAQYSTYTDNGLYPSTEYTYRITSVDTTGNASNGSSITKTTFADTTPPANPTNLVLTTTDGTRVTVKWTNPNDVDFAAVRVYRDNVLQTSISSTRLNALTWISDGLTPSTSYTFKVTSVDTTGNESIGVSSTITTGAVVANDVTPPKDVTSLSENHTSSTVTLSYYNPSDADFAKTKIYRNNVLVSEKIGTIGGAMTFTDTGLNLSTSYLYKVTTVDTTGNESGGNIISATTNGDTTPPGNITNLVVASKTTTSFTFTFTKPNDADFVKTKIYRTINSFPTYIGETNSNTYTDSNLTHNTSYTYTFKTIDTANNESSGTVLTVSTTADTTPPAEVTSLRYSATTSTVTLYWTNPVDTDFSYVDIFMNGSHEGSSNNGTFTSVSLINNNNYTYKLVTVDTNGNRSTGITIQTATAEPVDTTPPANVTNLNVAATTSSSITLSWTNPVTSDYYKSYIYRNGMFVAEVVANNSWTQNGLASSTTYNFEVRTVDTTGNAQSNGVTISGTTKAAVDDGNTNPDFDTTPPANVTDLGYTRTATSIFLNWTNPSDVDFAKAQIFRNEILVGETTSNVFSDNNLNSGNTYTYKVSSVDASGNRSMGTVITITLAPTSVTAYTFTSLTDFANFKMYYRPYNSSTLVQDTTKTLWSIKADPVVAGVNAAFTNVEYNAFEFNKYLTFHESLQFGGTVQIEYRPLINAIGDGFRLYAEAPADSNSNQLLESIASSSSYIFSPKYNLLPGERDITAALLKGNQTQTSEIYIKKIIIERY